MIVVIELVFNIAESAELLHRVFGVFPHYPVINDVQAVPNLENFLNESRSGLDGCAEDSESRNR